MKKLFILLLLIFTFLVVVSASIALLLGNRGTLSIGEKVALVTLDGPIMGSRAIVDELKGHSENSSVKAIVLRINSPGGAVAPSQEIFYEVQRIAADIPVVVSMGTVAASGGYYIAAPATKIMANPGTLTGSIGVIMEIPNVKELMDKVGIKTQVIKSGKNKDMASAFKDMSKEEREILQSVIDDVYAQFIEDVASSRNIDLEKVRQMADGRVYTGRQALELGLVDSLGGLESAIKLSAELGGIEGEPDVIIKKDKQTFIDMLTSKFSAQMPGLTPNLQVKYFMIP